MNTSPNRSRPRSAARSPWRTLRGGARRPASRLAAPLSPEAASCSRWPTRARPSGTSRTSPGSSRPSCSSASRPASCPSTRLPRSFNCYYQGVGAQLRAPSAACCRGRARRRAALRADVDERMQALLAARAGDAEIATLVDARPAARAAAPGADPHRHQAPARRNPHNAGLRPALADGRRSAAAAALVRLRRRPGRARPFGRARRRVLLRQRDAAPPRIRRAVRARLAAGDLRRLPRLHRRRRLRAARALAVDGLGRGQARRHASAPLYWRATATAGSAHACRASVEIDPHTPVCHLSFFEADAFARWAGARLPTELEWELAARRCTRRSPGNFADRGAFHPLPQPRPVGDEPVQMFGDVWEWTTVRLPAPIPATGRCPAPSANTTASSCATVRAARRLMRDAGRPRARELSQLLPARRAVAVQRPAPRARRVVVEAVASPQARPRLASRLSTPAPNTARTSMPPAIDRFFMKLVC